MYRAIFFALLCLVLTCKSLPAWAGDFVEDQPASGSSAGEAGDSTFDPFSDYSEFEEGSEEEADVNFFHNGRFFSVGLIGGYQFWTDTLGQFYAPNFGYGAFLSYFFDLRFALEVDYFSANHNLGIATSAGTFTGQVSLQRFEANLKYYMNTQNVTRGLGKLNPYLIFGFGDWVRTTSFNGTIGVVKDGAFGVQGGFGVEVPIMHSKGFVGAQATFNYVGFPDANSQVVINGVPQGIRPNGNAVDLLGKIGLNF